MAGAVCMTSESASRLLRDLPVTGGRQAAVAEAAARQERLASSAGQSSRTLLPVAPSASIAPAPASSKGPGSSAGPLAPAPLDWTAPTGNLSGDPRAFSTQPGGPVSNDADRRRRAEARQKLLGGRDALSQELNQSFCEENAIKGPSRPQYQRAFAAILVFLATVSGWHATGDQVSPSAFKTTSIGNPPLLDASMCDYFDYLYFSGAQAHEAEKSKAALVHYLPDLNIQTSLPRMLRAPNGFRKLNPGSSRFPLPGRCWVR